MASHGNNNHQNNQRDNGIMDSIAALRSVLMLDTPIRNVLAAGRSVNFQKQEAQKQLCFSPTSMTQATTPASRNTHINTPVSRNKTSASEKPSSSPLFKTPTPSRLPLSPEVHQSATKVLEKKIQLLEASHAELEERLKGEIDQRETLKTTYEKLSEFQTKQSSQLEQITVSRDTVRDESIALKKLLETERNHHSKTIAFLQTTKSRTIQSERFREKEIFRTETERLKKRLQKTESRYAESEYLVKSLTNEVEKLNAELNKLRQTHESAVQKLIESYTKEIAVLQDKLEQTESGLVEQINKERQSSEENYEKLQKALKQRTKLREDFLSEKEKMKNEKSELQKSLKEATDGRKESERKLEEVTDEVSRLRRQVTDDQLSRQEFEGKAEKFRAELDAAKDKLATSEVLQVMNDELKQQLRDAKFNSSKLPAGHDQFISVEGSQELLSENRMLQQTVKDVEETHNQLLTELQDTRMELDGLKQNREEAERIELRNEELKEQLKANKSDTKRKDQLLHNMELELKMVRTESQKLFDGNEHLEIVDKLQKEAKKLKEELAHSKEKLGISRVSNLNRLVEVATHREKVRDLEGDLEELEDKLHESPEAEGTDDRKRESEDDVLPRKRLKMREYDKEVDYEDDKEIVL